MLQFISFLRNSFLTKENKEKMQFKIDFILAKNKMYKSVTTKSDITHVCSDNRTVTIAGQLMGTASQLKE
jgi:hypothetical protein